MVGGLGFYVFWVFFFSNANARFLLSVCFTSINFCILKEQESWNYWLHVSTCTFLVTSFRSNVLRVPSHYETFPTKTILSKFNNLLCPNLCHKKMRISSQTKHFISKNIFWWGFCIDKGDNPKSLTLNSGNSNIWASGIGKLFCTII